VTAAKTATGSLYGLAYGDALGRPTEFMGYDQIVARHGQGGPTDLPEPPLVTDDTQMALAVARALRAVNMPGQAGVDTPTPAATLDALTERLTGEFVTWLHSPDNNRAPGNTCLTACASLSRGVPWRQASIIGSKGCGANMRVTPVGLVGSYDLDILTGIAQLQSALTHGHPTALAASELTALAVRLLRDGSALAELPSLLLDRCREQRKVYRREWLGDLWEHAQDADEVAFISRGWDDCAHALEVLRYALGQPDDGGDLCVRTGQGWIAEEALATALHAALRHPDDPVAALGRAAATSGDSDSIACLAGAFHGAAYGMAAWPASWADRIEHTDELAALGAAWD
jgi:ADP-ribosylglycohydrolase